MSVRRALQRKSDILLLDEPTTFVDRETALRLKAHLASKQNQIVVVVTHWAGLAAEADHVVVLGDGRVLEQGPPQELLNQGGSFARLLEDEQHKV